MTEDRNAAPIWSAALLIVAALCVAGFMQGLTGFGFGLIAMALLPLLTDMQSAASVAVIINILVTAMTLNANRRHFAPRLGCGLILGACCGVPIGVYLLVAAPHGALLHALGAVMVLFAVHELLLSCRFNWQLPQGFGFPLGVISGGLSGAFNMGGPPAIAYAYAQPWSKEQIVAVLQVVFGVSAVLRLILMGASGLLTASLLQVVLWAALPVTGAILLGHRFFQRIAQEQLKKGVFCFLGLMGLKYLLFS